jgi:hypothetical protein
MSTRSMDGPYDCLPWLFWKWPYDFPIAVVTDCGGSGMSIRFIMMVLGLLRRLINYDGFENGHISGCGDLVNADVVL